MASWLSSSWTELVVLPPNDNDGKASFMPRYSYQLLNKNASPPHPPQQSFALLPALSCFRNPFVLFFSTLAVLVGYLLLFGVSNTTGSTYRTTTIEYRLMEEAQLPPSSQQQRSIVYRKYKAFHPNTQLALTVQQWAELVTAEQHNVESTTTASALLSQVIREVPYQAVFFETPPVTSDTIQQQPFEFVLVDAPDLNQKMDHAVPNLDVFANHFQSPDCHNQLACTFATLSGDTVLITPVPPTSMDTTIYNSYTHLTNFVRNAPPLQVSALWAAAATALLNRVVVLVDAVSEGSTIPVPAPVWFSTNGMSIAWVHFRLDSNPKYYNYSPYKESMLTNEGLRHRRQRRVLQ